jgi:inosine-uridine nucleoside N-ribohydrolase
VKLVIDADPGIGDALAIALALRDPEVELIGLTAVAGRVSGDQATRNLHAILSLLDPSRWPRVGCSDSPATFWPPEPGSPEPVLLHGECGLGDIDTPITGLHQKHEAAKVLVELARTNPNEVTLLTLGPLSNLERAAELWPEFWTHLRGVVCLGGAFLGPGDVTATAEFNIFSDPEAARAFFQSPATKTVLPLETARAVQISFEHYNRLNGNRYSRLGQLLERTLPFALRSHRQYLGKEVLWLPEVAALAAVSQSQFFDANTMAVDVEIHGELTQGMTIADRRPGSQWKRDTEVLTHVDARGVLGWFERLIASE